MFDRKDYEQLWYCFLLRISRKALESDWKVGLAKPTYAESLPKECPPEDASTEAMERVFRLTKSETLSETDFYSHAHQGKIKPEEHKATDCQWASCSFFTSSEAALAIKGLRRRHPWVTELSIPAEAGKHKLRGEHIDFWRFADFDVVAAVEDHWRHDNDA